jgi:NitT/TauT family transport system permease protein
LRLIRIARCNRAETWSADALGISAPKALVLDGETPLGELNPARAPRERTRWLELRREIPVWSYRALALGSFLAVIALWAWISQRDFVNPVFVPTPGSVWEAARDILADESLWLDLKASFLRVSAGFLLAAALGVPLGILMGSFKVFEGLLQPITEFVRYIPVPALIPICMVLFGIDELSKIMLIWLGTFFQLVLMVADETRRVPYELLQVSYTLGARRREVLRLVMWRAARPGIFDALRLCNGWAWTYLVVAEVVATDSGLGYSIMKAQRFMRTDEIWVGILVLGFLGLATDMLFKTLQPRLLPWAEVNKN